MLTLRARVETMRAKLFRAVMGIALAVVLIYLFRCIHFQSWIRPAFHFLMAVPFALGG